MAMSVSVELERIPSLYDGKKIKIYTMARC